MEATKNVGGVFKFGGNATKPTFISNYVNRDPSEPPVNHRFRVVDKKKWVAGPLRLC